MMPTRGQLVVDRVTKRFDTPSGPQTVLEELSFTAAPGETVAILGPSGSGKSTLLNIIGSLDAPTSGTVRLGEVEVTALASEALAQFRARSVGFIFQDHHLLPQLTALENVMLPTLAAGSTQSAGERAVRLLERMGVAERAKALPARMSGGERQRVAAARALINGAGLLLCDEPTGNLDRDAASNLVGLLLELAEQQDVTVLMVTHNVEQARRLGRCLLLRDGRVAPYAGSRTPGVNP